MYSYKGIALALFFGGVLFMLQGGIAVGEKEKAEKGRLRLHVVFNNVPYGKGLETSWGFSCLIEGLDKTILFDTGGDGGILLSNMQHLGLDPEAVDAVVFSHLHLDHTGGLGALLACHPDVTVYMPESFPASFQQKMKRLGTTIETVSGPRQLMYGVYSTGEMGFAIKEQALIVDTQEGLVLITGCAHPNVTDIAERAKTYRGKNIYLLMGGFHLGGASDAEIRAIIRRLKELGVKKVAPSHCTGHHTIRLFRDEWGDDFIEGGLGAIIEVPR
jgi:7,8-dihydropterin-6-yl-methyl-4-(beta-D-ribofuranosyl)aminobenzene 5'-phosphate synthase